MFVTPGIWQRMAAVQANAMITAELLRRIRNDLAMPATIAALGRHGPPA